MGNGQGKPVCFSDEGTWGSGSVSVSVSSSSPRSAEIRRQQHQFRTRRRLNTVLVSRDHQLTRVCVLVNLNHFRLLRVVGKGAFGKVRIVERKDTGLTFALKYIRKDEGEDSQFRSRICSTH
jgi:hypothetical protein